MSSGGGYLAPGEAQGWLYPLSECYAVDRSGTNTVLATKNLTDEIAIVANPVVLPAQGRA